MRAVEFQGNGVLSLVDRKEPTVTHPDDVLVRVEANGLCGSDLRALTTPPQMVYEPGTVIGHEFAGTVVDVGESVSSVRAGQRVVAIPNINCQTCWYCRTGKTNLCETFVHIGATRDGGAAEYVRIPERLALPIPLGMTAELGALAEPLACVLNGTQMAAVQPGDRVLVQGAGPVGLLYMLIFKRAGASVVVSETSPSRRQAASGLGADLVIDPLSEDGGATLSEFSEGRGVDVAVDAVGHLLPQSVDAVRKDGLVLVFGLNEAASATISPARLTYGELRVQGVYIAKGTFPLAIEMLDENSLEFDRLITDRVNLSDIDEAVRLAKAGETMKVMLLP